VRTGRALCFIAAVRTDYLTPPLILAIATSLDVRGVALLAKVHSLVCSYWSNHSTIGDLMCTEV